MMTIPCPLCPGVHPDPGTLPCPGPCNTAWARAEHHTHTTGQPHDLKPVPGQPLWCPDCRHRIEETLVDLPHLAAKLGSGPLATPPTEVGRLSRAQIHASPSPAYDLWDEYARWVAAWEDVVRGWLRHPPGADLVDPFRSTSYLVGHLSPILARDPDGVEFGCQTLTWHRRLRHATGATTAVLRVPGECGTCGRRGTLSRRDGSEVVRCGACSACVDYSRTVAA